MSNNQNLLKVKENPNYLKELSEKEQTEEICLEAVKQDGWLLKYVYDKTDKVCFAAAKQYGIVPDLELKDVDEEFIERTKEWFCD